MQIKKTVIASILFAVICAGGFLAADTAYADAASAADSTAYDSTPDANSMIMRKWADYGTLLSDDNSDLNPNAPVLREEAARMLSTIILFRSERYNYSPLAFSDVGEDSPYYEHVKVVALTGVMNGIRSDVFGVGQVMTREDAAVVLYRVFAAYLDAKSVGSFNDLWQSSSWAGGSIMLLAGNGIVHGYSDGRFRPHNAVTRLEFVLMLDRLMPTPGKVRVVLPDPKNIPDFDRTDPKPVVVDPYAHLRDKKLIALTFDDGPFREQTPRVLDELSAKGVKATFFMTGNRAQAWPDTVRRVVNEGHQLANHSYSHKSLTGMSAESVKWEINHTNDLLEEISGVRPTVLRPPFGSINARTAETAGMPIIMWSIDPQDWDGKTSDYIVSFVTSRARDGDIILLHDPVSASIRATPVIIDMLHREGFTFVTVDELIAVRGGAENGTVYYRFR